jgi:hypothetical protein
MMGPWATDEQLATTRAAVLENPRGWIAQPVVTFSTCPTVVEDGRIAPRHVDLRPFAVNDGTNVFVLPGGLSRVALPEGSLVVNSSQGGGSKDTWVIDDGTLDDAPAESASPEPAERSLSDAVAANFSKRYNSPTSHEDRLVQQQRQQQQSRQPAQPSDGEASC